MAKSKSLQVNGKRITVPFDDPTTPLLYVLRNDAGLHGPKFGCGLGQCGACTVHINGKATRSCVTTLEMVKETDAIVTLEGLGSLEKPHPLQQAFIDEQAAQCGYCLNGMIMQAVELLAHNRNPSPGEIKDALGNNLCRCGTHFRILRAIERAAHSA